MENQTGAYVDSENLPKEIVYFISYVDGPVKIGQSTDVRARLSNLQTSIPYELMLLGTMKGPRGLERAIHAQFADARMIGEWFRPTPRLFKFIQANADKPTAELSLRALNIVKPDPLRNPQVRRQFCKRSKKKTAITISQHEVADMVSHVMGLWLEASREMLDAVNQVENNLLEKHGLHYDLNPVRLRFRRVVDQVLGVHWKTAEIALYSEDGGWGFLDRYALRWVRRTLIKYFNDAPYRSYL